MRRYYEALNRDPFDVIPLTFHIKSAAQDDKEYKAFMSKFSEIEAGHCLIKKRNNGFNSKKEEIPLE